MKEGESFETRLGQKAILGHKIENVEPKLSRAKELLEKIRKDVAEARRLITEYNQTSDKIRSIFQAEILGADKDSMQEREDHLRNWAVRNNEGLQEITQRLATLQTSLVGVETAYTEALTEYERTKAQRKKLEQEKDNPPSAS